MFLFVFMCNIAPKFGKALKGKKKVWKGKVRDPAADTTTVT
jgi:hypothetical protein